MGLGAVRVAKLPLALGAAGVYSVARMSLLAQSLALGSADYSWRANANCRDTDPELFFPLGNTGEALRMLVRARAVCADCDVRQKCLDFAMATNQDCGVWGGTSEDERRDLRRRAAAARRAGIA